eukprot:CAMPEP_0119545736 /NCGR_PEP_ID=MMETSP1352-20130426/410_1 /TAXON_ID=265584 /ORGANISM="Stauroneis constricta, Strain CCMP1120" /LENGTH=146 /DNA_ID=CAMNT_0007590331 /DNA_START=99 /DNA_END=539 /DNA_ORIENTATION=+
MTTMISLLGMLPMCSAFSVAQPPSVGSRALQASSRSTDSIGQGDFWYAKYPVAQTATTEAGDVYDNVDVADVNGQEQPAASAPVHDDRFVLPEDLWTNNIAENHDHHHHTQDFSSVFKIASHYPSAGDMDIDTFSTLVNHINDVYL